MKALNLTFNSNGREFVCHRAEDIKYMSRRSLVTRDFDCRRLSAVVLYPHDTKRTTPIPCCKSTLIAFSLIFKSNRKAQLLS
jgi:hypothetical protein